MESCILPIKILNLYLDQAAVTLMDAPDLDYSNFSAALKWIHINGNRVNRGVAAV